jgi:hypothetical protein
MLIHLIILARISLINLILLFTSHVCRTLDQNFIIIVIGQFDKHLELLEYAAARFPYIIKEPYFLWEHGTKR